MASITRRIAGVFATRESTKGKSSGVLQTNPHGRLLERPPLSGDRRVESDAVSEGRQRARYATTPQSLRIFDLSRQATSTDACVAVAAGIRLSKGNREGVGGWLGQIGSTCSRLEAGGFFLVNYLELICYH